MGCGSTPSIRPRGSCGHIPEGGEIGPAEPLIRFEDGWGKPDGLTLDAEGHLWICHYGASRITRFRPDGSIERVLPIPTALVTKCAFGGPDLTTLYVTTCQRGRDPAIDPMAGHLFRVETPFKGLPARLYELPLPDQGPASTLQPWQVQPAWSQPLCSGWPSAHSSQQNAFSSRFTAFSSETTQTQSGQAHFTISTFTLLIRVPLRQMLRVPARADANRSSASADRSAIISC